MACLLGAEDLYPGQGYCWVPGKDSVYAPWLWFLVDMSRRGDSAVPPTLSSSQL